MSQIVGAIGWSVLAIAISQGTSIFLMSWLGLPPKKLIHEIEEVQNPAVGAVFFTVSLTVALFVSMFVTDAFDREPQSITYITGAAWIVGAFLLGMGFTWLNFIVAHRVMGRENNESVVDYIRRELIEEQNASLAFFLGSLSIVPFISVLFQTI